MGELMSVLIMLALGAYAITTIVGFVFAMWLIKVFMPFYKTMFKQMQEQLMELSEEEEA